VKRKAGSYLAAFPDSPAFVAQRPLLTNAKSEKVLHANEKAGLVTRLRFIQLVVGFLDDDDEASLDVRLDLQATRGGLVVVE